MKKSDFVRVYRTLLGRGWEWRWTRFAGNGWVVGCSSESYRNRKECIANARRCMTECAVEVET